MKTLAILTVLTAVAAHAQEETAPPLLSAEVPCVSDRDCDEGASCVRAERRGKQEPGVCRAGPRPLRQRYLDEKVERFEYRGVEPEGFHLVSEVRLGLLGGGIAAFAGGYGLSLLAGLGTGAPLGAIPLLGPLFVGASWWSPSSGFLAGFANFWVVLLVAVDLVAQGAGIVMMSVAGGAPQRWLERNVATNPVATIVPGAPGAPLGASVVARF